MPDTAPRTPPRGARPAPLRHGPTHQRPAPCPQDSLRGASFAAPHTHERRASSGAARWWLAWGAAWLAALALGGCCDDVETVAEISEPVSARIVITEGNNLGGSGNHFVCSPKLIPFTRKELFVGELKMTLFDPLSIDGGTRLVADKDGERLAYEIPSLGQWRVIYVGQHHLIPWHPTLEAEPDWKALPSLDDALVALYQLQPNHHRRDDVLCEAKKLGGDKRLAKMLIDVSDEGEPDESWVKHFKELPDKHRARVEAHLLKALRDDQKTHSAHLAARLLDLRGDKDSARAMKKLYTHLDAEDPPDQETLGKLLVMLSTVDPGTAETLACEHLKGERLESKRQPRDPRSWPADAHNMGAAMTLAAVASKPCIAITDALEHHPCAPAMRRQEASDAPLAALDELQKATDARLQAPAPFEPFDQLNGDLPRKRQLQRWALTAALRTDAVPEAVVRANARRLAPLPAAGPPCEDAKRAGQPCQCAEAPMREAVCRQDAGQTQLRWGNCEATTDARGVEQVRSLWPGAVGHISWGLGVGLLVAPDGSVQEVSRPNPADDPGLPLVAPAPVSIEQLAGRLPATMRAPVEGLEDVTMTAAGASHHCALHKDGGVSCWGGNTEGQIKPTSPSDRRPPTRMSIKGRASAVAVGQYHACALLEAGAVWCWGDNRALQLGHHMGEPGAHDPAPVEGLPEVVELASWGLMSCARTAEGDVWCWGGFNHQAFSAPVLRPELAGASVLGLSSGRACAVVDTALTCLEQQGQEIVETSTSLGDVPGRVVAIVPRGRTSAVLNDKGEVFGVAVDQGQPTAWTPSAHQNRFTGLASPHSTYMPTLCGLDDKGEVWCAPSPSTRH